jgi:hypothetical protein
MPSLAKSMRTMSMRAKSIHPLLVPLAFAMTFAACAGAKAPPPASPSTLPPTASRDSAAATRDTIADPNLIPAGLGSLRQDDIAIRIDINQLQVKAIPLDEAVIRTLGPDSYKALHELVESRRAELNRIAQRRGMQNYRVWYVTFFALQADQPYNPREFTIENAGRQYQPVEVLPLSAGFGSPRLRLREQQAALYMFESGIDMQQPTSVQVENERSDVWQSIIRRVERERALIRSRSQSRNGQPQ